MGCIAMQYTIKSVKVLSLNRTIVAFQKSDKLLLNLWISVRTN